MRARGMKMVGRMVMGERDDWRGMERASSEDGGDTRCLW